MLALAEKIGDNGEVVRVAVDETSKPFERAVRVALILTLTNEEGRLKTSIFQKLRLW